MTAAVHGSVWILFGVVLALCAGLIIKTGLTLRARLSGLRADLASPKARLDEALAEVTDLLEQTSDGMAKLQARRLRDRS